MEMQFKEWKLFLWQGQNEPRKQDMKGVLYYLLFSTLGNNFREVIGKDFPEMCCKDSGRTLSLVRKMSSTLFVSNNNNRIEMFSSLELPKF